MNPDDLKTLAASILPELAEIINIKNPLSDTTWLSDLSTGKALEFITLCLLLESFKHRGYEVTIDSYFSKKPGQYYLRNEIPYHHGAQAGHEGKLLDGIPLKDRFISSLLPKAYIREPHNEYMIFREGNPMHVIDHAIYKDSTYKLRPDLIIVEGNIEVSVKKSLELTYTHKDKKMWAELAIKDQNILPLKDHYSDFECDIPTLSVIECSVSKTSTHANKQITEYLELFNNSYNAVSALFVNGVNKESKYKSIIVDIDSLSSKDYLYSVKELFNAYVLSLTNS